jgi:hypothetical protein
MNVIVLRLEGEERYLVIDRLAGSVEEVELPGSLPVTDAKPSRFKGIAEAIALPDLDLLSSRKYYAAA